MFVKASQLAAEAGNAFLWEHPEHLGVAADGVVPSSIWSWPEILDLLVRFKAVTFAIFQCMFGAQTSKPTRFLSNLARFQRAPPPHATLPCLDSHHRYFGPLPKSCPHGRHDSLVGKDPVSRQWRTAASAAYPPKLCQFLAEAIASSQSPGSDGVHTSLATITPSPECTSPAPPEATAQGRDALTPSPKCKSPATPEATAQGRDTLTPLDLGFSTASGSRSLAPRAATAQGRDAVAPSASGFRASSGSSIGSSPTPLAGQVSMSSGTITPLPSEDAEAFAARFLAKEGLMTKDELRALHQLLPKERPVRVGEEVESASSFTVGAYCKGGLVGLRHCTEGMPCTSQVLTRYVCQISPKFSFSAVSLFHGIRTTMHRDSRNAPFPNMVAPITSFKGGQIWVEDCHGSVPEMTPDGLKVGKDLEVAKGPVIFDAYKAFHFTRAWEGERLVVVAYVTDHLDTLKDGEKQVLERQGFQLPAQEAETSEAIELEFGAPHGSAPPGAEPAFKPELCGNRGLPLQAEWEGKQEPLNDGFGLCSPTRWRPADRGATLSPSSMALCRDMPDVHGVRGAKCQLSKRALRKTGRWRSHRDTFL